MPKMAKSARQDAVNSPEVKQLLSGCRNLLVNLVVRLPGFLLVGEVLHVTRIWIIWDRGIIQLPGHQFYSCYVCDK